MEKVRPVFETSTGLNNLSLNQLKDLIQDYVGETEITFFLYDASGKLLLSFPDEDVLKDSSHFGQVRIVTRQAALAAFTGHRTPLQSDNHCLAELIRYRDEVHGVLVGFLDRPSVEPQVVPLWETIMRAARRRIEAAMSTQKEMDSLSEEVLHSYRELGLVTKLSTELAEATDLETVYRVTLEQMIQIVDADSGCIFNLDKSADELRMVGFYPETVGADAFDAVQFGEGLIGKIAETGESIIIENAGHPMWRPQAGFPFTPPLMGCALQISQNPLGVIVVAKNPTDRVFTSGDLKILETAALQSAVVMRNITLLHNLEHTQTQVLQNGKMEAVGQLAAGIAHEINTPIAYIHSNIGTLAEYTDQLFELFQEYEGVITQLGIDQKSSPLLGELAAFKEEIGLEFIAEDTSSLISESRDGIEIIREIVQNLGNFAQTNRTPVQEVNLNDLIPTVLGVLGEQFFGKIAVIKELGSISEIYGHAAQLNQALLNLLTNAVEAIEDAGEIYITTYQDEQHICVSIRDTGKGIPQEHLPRLFDPFFTTKDVGEGCGLGLSEAYQIIQQNGGEIRVESEVGEGTTFILQLPTTDVIDELLE
ncbi:MAG: ATP-binding protein [Candidatus Poribacteria bacterium]|nr:ATP-binding protein [Candidatus Poribacteria bacterium]